MSADFSQPNAQPFALAAGDSALLLIHGFTGSPGHMRFIGNAVHAAGFSAHGILLPGHGTSLEDMERSDGAQWLAACRDAYLALAREYRRVSVAGLSLGGVLSVLLAAEFDPACVILFAPAMRYKKGINYLSPVAKHVLHTARWQGGRPEEDFLTEYDFGYAGTPVSRVEEMTRLQKRAWRALPEIHCPALVFQSHADQSVHAEVPDAVMRQVSSPVREISWVDRSPHVLTLGPDREYVCDRVIDFLRRYAV